MAEFSERLVEELIEGARVAPQQPIHQFLVGVFHRVVSVPPAPESFAPDCAAVDDRQHNRQQAAEAHAQAADLEQDHCGLE